MTKTLAKDLPKSPVLGASWLSCIFFWWLNDFMGLGNKKDLELRDLYQPIPADNATNLSNKLEELWNNEQQKKIENKKLGTEANSKNRQLLRALWRQFGGRYMVLGLLLFVEECFTRVLQPICLGYLISYFRNSGEKDSYGFLLCAAVVFCSSFYNITHHTFIFGVLKLGMQMRIACSSLIYRKAISLNQKSLSNTTMGQMITLLSNDVNRFDQLTVYLHYLWLGIVQVIVIHIVLWFYVGPSCLVGLAAIFVLSTMQGFLGKSFSKLRTETSVKTDKRVSLMNEILGNMRVIKMYVWEKPFELLVTKARREEINIIKKRTYLRAANLSLFYSAIKIIVFFVLLHFVLTGNSITAEIVFVVLSLYNNISILWFVSESGTSPIAEALVSIKRIQTFLMLDNHNVSKGRTEIEKDIVEGKRIEISNACASWGTNTEDFTLNNINLTVSMGELVAIIGRVGSSKSSLLQVLLQELPCDEGSAKVNGSIGYVSQEPWVFSGTVRENILFGKPFDLQWYNKVINACALKQDFKTLVFGDETEVGEKGASLSGGQKARVSLARAVYANADVYLLDDPLSAVDANVGQHIFQECIKGVLSSKACLLVTHQTQFSKQADRVLKVESGRLSPIEKSHLDKIELNEVENQPSLSKHEDLAFNNLPEHFEVNDIDELDSNVVRNDISNEESTVGGSLSGLVYWKYFRAGSNFFTFSLLVAFNIFAQLFYTGSDYWLNLWATSEENHSKNNVTNNSTTNTISQDIFTKINNDRHLQLWVFSACIGGLVLMALLRSLTFVRICMNASIKLHQLMFKGVVEAPIKFLNENALGRVLNRFGKDIGQIDDLLPTIFLDTIGIFLNIIGIMIVTGVISPLTFIPSGISLVVFYFIRRFYLRTARNIKRLEGTARSLGFSHLSNSILGLPTLRAFKLEKDFALQFDNYQDLHTATWYLSLATSRWFGIWLDWVSVVFIGCVTFSFMFVAKNAGEVGLAISSSMLLTGMLQWGARQSAEVENQMVSVERILEYTKIEPEQCTRPLLAGAPKSWPDNGEIKCTDLELKYNDTPVLKNLTFRINSGEKIGVVGRTGAGKSSLLSALFRLAEPSGAIEIAGVDILSLPLKEVRSKLSIIPQEPVLFSGNLRQNLDPLNLYCDANIEKVLQEVCLYPSSSKSSSLDDVVLESGSNFSVGQRQLICLARAILEQNKIIILDEATANLDSETDSFIQQLIRTKFNNSTVITVAHRLGTVMDSDRIMVLDDGKIMEFDAPYNLLQNEHGLLSQLVRLTGKDNAAQLHEIAINSYLAKEE